MGHGGPDHHGVTRGGGDILLAGPAPDVTPRWATGYGAPAPDGPLSSARRADGSLVVIGRTTSRHSSSRLRDLMPSPESVPVARHVPDGPLQWAQVHSPGELVIANPVVRDPRYDKGADKSRLPSRPPIGSPSSAGTRCLPCATPSGDMA